MLFVVLFILVASGDWIVWANRAGGKTQLAAVSCGAGAVSGDAVGILNLQNRAHFSPQGGWKNRRCLAHFFKILISCVSLESYVALLMPK